MISESERLRAVNSEVKRLRVMPLVGVACSSIHTLLCQLVQQFGAAGQMRLNIAGGGGCLLSNGEQKCNEFFGAVRTAFIHVYEFHYRFKLNKTELARRQHRQDALRERE